MLMKVVTDHEGNIIATAYVSPKRAEGAPTEIGIVPEHGQQIFDVDATPEIAEMPAHELHAKYRLEAKTVQAKLVARGASKA